MKLLAATIASLSLLATSWAQVKETKGGQKVKPMRTLNDIPGAAATSAIRK